MTDAPPQPRPLPHQLAAALTKAANMRRDVRKATIQPVEGRPELLQVAVEFYTPGRRIERETRTAQVLDGRTTGEILDAWLGPAEPLTAGARLAESQAARELRELTLSLTPAQLVDRARRRETAPPRSRLEWREADRTDDQPGMMHAEVPREPREADAAPADRKLTRREMIDRGMTREQRHEQYRRQGGPHPADADSGTQGPADAGE